MKNDKKITATLFDKQTKLYTIFLNFCKKIVKFIDKYCFLEKMFYNEIIKAKRMGI